MQTKFIEVQIKVNVYNHKLIVDDKETFTGYCESKLWIFNIADYSQVGAIEKAKQYLKNYYKQDNKFIDIVSYTAYEEPIITAFFRDLDEEQ